MAGRLPKDGRLQSKPLGTSSCIHRPIASHLLLPSPRHCSSSRTIRSTLQHHWSPPGIVLLFIGHFATYREYLGVHASSLKTGSYSIIACLHSAGRIAQAAASQRTSSISGGQINLGALPFGLRHLLLSEPSGPFFQLDPDFPGHG